ncbi:enoyl-CoA hydratase/isomerase family protein [Nocardia sienata]|uniref:enoyl-CoA hydratase/isomerase family protein n=1 Tax=Nocardia sienata TaxID=248552 RepID=UPI0007A39A7F|nr:enoyl-CoA hydratase/isomerase family protein [Nocardia sienata]
MDEATTSWAPEILELGLAADGSPDNPVVVVPLDQWEKETEQRIERFAGAVAASLRLTIGVARGPIPAAVAPLVRASTLTLVEMDEPPGVEMPEVVGCTDIAVAVDRLAAAIGHSPRASAALGRLLRQTAVLDTASGLSAEAAVYSMLLGGVEFRRWLADRGPSRTAPSPEGDVVRLQRSGDQLTVTLDNVARRNALSFRLREELLEAVRLAEFDPSIEHVSLRGAGPVFCSGGDLDEFGTASDLIAAYLIRQERAPWRIIDRLRDRVSAHVHGACIGAGIEMAAFAGRLVAAPDTVFRLPEVGMGLVPGAGGTVGVTRRIGRWRAAWMMLTGESLDTETALRWNLIDAVAPIPSLEAETRAE